MVHFLTTAFLLLVLACSPGDHTGPLPVQVAPAPVSSADTTYFALTAELKSNTIPDSVFKLVHLKHLSITGMDCDYGDHTNCWGITDIPPGISNLKDLETLRLVVNGISSLPAGMKALEKLRVLDLTDNPGLRDIEVITQLISLEELDLYGCNLDKLPADIGNLKRLKSLGLTGNHLDLNEVQRLKKALPGCKMIFN